MKIESLASSAQDNISLLLPSLTNVKFMLMLKVFTLLFSNGKVLFSPTLIEGGWLLAFVSTLTGDGWACIVNVYHFQPGLPGVKRRKRPWGPIVLMPSLATLFDFVSIQIELPFLCCIGKERAQTLRKRGKEREAEETWKLLKLAPLLFKETSRDQGPPVAAFSIHFSLLSGSRASSICHWLAISYFGKPAEVENYFQPQGWLVVRERGKKPDQLRKQVLGAKN